jgi:hypothetical protein
MHKLSSFLINKMCCILHTLNQLTSSNKIYSQKYPHIMCYFRCPRELNSVGWTMHKICKVRGSNPDHQKKDVCVKSFIVIWYISIISIIHK